MELEHEIAIRTAPEQVFARLIDWAGHPEWIEGLVASEALDGDVAVGQRFRQELQHGPLRIELDGEVTELLHPTRLGFEARARDVVLDCRIELSPVADGTRLRQRTEIKLESFMLKMMASRVADELGTKQAADLERLKAVLESTSV